MKLAEIAELRGGRAAGALGHYRVAFGIAEALVDENRLAPRDAWMVADLKAQIGRLEAAVTEIDDP